MIAQLLIHPDAEVRVPAAEDILTKNGLSRNHPNLLWFDPEAKLGVEQAKQIKTHLQMKPYQGKSQAVVVTSAHNLSIEAQNALLKILEEPPADCLVVLGISSETQLLPTIISRCQVINLQSTNSTSIQTLLKKYSPQIEKLLSAPIEQRFVYLEKLDNREDFYQALVAYFNQQLIAGNLSYHQFNKDLIRASEWADGNVNIRAILEYLMLRMPFTKMN